MNSVVSVLFSGWLTWLTLQPVIQDYRLGSISLTGLRTPQWIPELLIPLGLAILTVQLLAKLALGITSSPHDASSPSPV